MAVTLFIYCMYFSEEPVRIHLNFSTGPKL